MTTNAKLIKKFPHKIPFCKILRNRHWSFVKVKEKRAVNYTKFIFLT